MSAVLQIDIDKDAATNGEYSGGSTRRGRMRALLTDALLDTLTNGGTFTCVVTSDRIVAAQHVEAIGMDEEDAPE
jgi:hypothetical protein